MRSRLLLIPLLLAGCSTTPQDLEKSTSTKSATSTYGENYQLIYKRVSDQAKRCLANNLGGTASLQVDAQLYNELGFGEISSSLLNFGTRNYYWKAKIERAGSGAKMTVYSGNTINNGVAIGKVSRWAAGDTSC